MWNRKRSIEGFCYLESARRKRTGARWNVLNVFWRKTGIQKLNWSIFPNWKVGYVQTNVRRVKTKSLWRDNETQYTIHNIIGRNEESNNFTMCKWKENTWSWITDKLH